MCCPVFVVLATVGMASPRGGYGLLKMFLLDFVILKRSCLAGSEFLGVSNSPDNTAALIELKTSVVF